VSPYANSVGSAVLSSRHGFTGGRNSQSRLGHPRERFIDESRAAICAQTSTASSVYSGQG